MADLPTLINQAAAVLGQLRSLDDKAGGDTSLEASIRDATTALDTLRLRQVKADQTEIDAASVQLDKVTNSANAALGDLTKIADAVADAASAVQMLGTIAALAK
jgi:hypothetical protein